MIRLCITYTELCVIAASHKALPLPLMARQSSPLVNYMRTSMMSLPRFRHSQTAGTQL